MRLIAVAFGIFLAAWVAGNPPGMAPDEPAHYRRAVGLAHGDVVGREATYSAIGSIPDSRRLWLNKTSRAVRVPAQFSGCGIFRLPIAGHCPAELVTRTVEPVPEGHEVTYVGTYPPYAYGLPAVGVWAAKALGMRSTGTLLIGRALLAAFCFGFVLLAARLLVHRGAEWVAVLGLTLAATPLAVFLFGQLSSSGVEVASALCFTAAALRLTRAEPHSGVWTALATAGVTLAVTRSSGPLWLVTILVLIACLRPREVAGLWGRHRRRMVAAGVALLTGIAGSVVWQVAVEPQPERSLASVLGGVVSALAQVDTVAAQIAGDFGWLDVPTPMPAKIAFVLLLAGFFGTAFLVGTMRERLVLLLAGAACLGSVVLIYAAFVRPTSPFFAMQGRYVLPLFVTIPLFGAEIIAAHAQALTERFGRRVRAVALAAIVSAVALHAYGWAVNLYHYRTNGGFLGQYPVGWQPAGGIPFWSGLVSVAAVLAILGSRRVMGTQATIPVPRPAVAVSEGEPARRKRIASGHGNTSQ